MVIMMKKIYETHSVEETIALGKAFCDILDKGVVVALEGDLGAGKTAFTKGIGLSLNIDEAISSPTFTLLKEYQGRLKLNHIDAYRLENMNSDTLALYDLMDDDAIVVIEWSNFIDDNINFDYIVKIEYLEDNSRSIEIEGENIEHIDY